LQRWLTGLPIAAAAIALIYLAPAWLFLAVVAGVALLTLDEFLDLAARAGVPAPRIGAFVGLLLVVVFRQPSWHALAALLALGWAALRAADLKDAFTAGAAAVCGVFYVGLPLRCLVEIRETAPALAFYALALTAFGDIAAYYGGRAFGRHKLAPRVSPGKTWEGAIASVVVSLGLFTPFLLYFHPRIPLAVALACGVAVNIAGQFGDLAESALKRGVGVKDSSTLIPGHGGVLDRLDAHLFALPVMWYAGRIFLGPYL
jgi:phosphatidate cytidylyltransferase